MRGAAGQAGGLLQQRLLPNMGMSSSCTSAPSLIWQDCSNKRYFVLRGRTLRWHATQERHDLPSWLIWAWCAPSTALIWQDDATLERAATQVDLSQCVTQGRTLLGSASLHDVANAVTGTTSAWRTPQRSCSRSCRGQCRRRQRAVVAAARRARAGTFARPPLTRSRAGSACSRRRRARRRAGRSRDSSTYSPRSHRMHSPDHRPLSNASALVAGRST